MARQLWAIFDVVVDLRPESPTRAKWAAVELTADNPTIGHRYTPRPVLRTASRL